MTYDREFGDVNQASKYAARLKAKLKGRSVEMTEEGNKWRVTVVEEESLRALLSESGKNFVKGMSGGMGLSDEKIESANSFGEVFEGTGKNFVKGLSGGMGLNKRRKK